MYPLHCIFDLDGTLFDSHAQIISAATWTRNLYGLQELDPRQIKNLIGLPARFLFEDVKASGVDISELVLSFRNRLRVEILKRNEVFPGVLETVSQFKSLGARLSVATTKPTELAQWTIKHSVLNGLIDYVQGTDDFGPKPDPEVILRCLRSEQLSHVIMFGDRTEDMQAACAAKVVGFGIAQSVHTQEELSCAGATHTFPSFAEHRKIIEVINKSVTSQ
jgi:phosphoglycolate phosphatase